MLLLGRDEHPRLVVVAAGKGAAVPPFGLPGGQV